ncbi:MAG: tripartite tricarboxylate transporter TctB family protein [Candidatus Methylomirabilota bacterium]
MNRSDLKLSTVVTFVLIVLSSAYFLESFNFVYWQKYGPGPGFAPRWASLITLGLLILCFFQSFKGEGIRLSETFPKGDGRVNILVTWASLILFVLFSKTLGFTVTSIAMLTVLFGRNMKWPKAVLISVIVSLCCFFIFKSLLQVPVPVNRFGW